MHTANIPKAVEALIYVIENEEAMPSTQQNRETLVACRNAPKALIGTRQVPKAKAWLESAREEAEENDPND